MATTRGAAGWRVAGNGGTGAGGVEARGGGAGASLAVGRADSWVDVLRVHDVEEASASASASAKRVRGLTLASVGNAPARGNRAHEARPSVTYPDACVRSAGDGMHP